MPGPEENIDDAVAEETDPGEVSAEDQIAAAALAGAKGEPFPFSDDGSLNVESPEESPATEEPVVSDETPAETPPAEETPEPIVAAETPEAPPADVYDIKAEGADLIAKEKETPAETPPAAEPPAAAAPPSAQPPAPAAAPPPTPETESEGELFLKESYPDIYEALDAKSQRHASTEVLKEINALKPLIVKLVQDHNAEQIGPVMEKLKAAEDKNDLLESRIAMSQIHPDYHEILNEAGYDPWVESMGPEYQKANEVGSFKATAQLITEYKTHKALKPVKQHDAAQKTKHDKKMEQLRTLNTSGAPGVATGTSDEQHKSFVRGAKEHGA